MNGPRILDILNTYVPDLSNIQESALRTYSAANESYDNEKEHLEKLEKELSSGDIYTSEKIYDISQRTAKVLAECSEQYLKAIYICEHNIPGNRVDELWDKLKRSDYKTDQNGQLVYEASNGKITFPKYDDNNEPIKDENGKIIYYDEEGNEYNENTRGKKIKRNGHQLDRLIETLSPESRLILETRMLTIPMDKTETNDSVSLFDILQEKGVVSLDKEMTHEEYVGWIEQHKNTFFECRYSGEEYHNISVDFMFHLTTQLRAVAQFIIEPKEEQVFNITDEELSNLPPEMEQLAAFHMHLISEDLIKLIASDEIVKNKLSELLSDNYCLPSWDLPPSLFCKMIKIMDKDEINYTSILSYYVKSIREDKNNSFKETDNLTIRIAFVLNYLKMKPNQVIRFLTFVKELYGSKVKIGDKEITSLLRIVKDAMDGNKTDTYSEDNKNTNYYLKLFDYKTNFLDLKKEINDKNTNNKINLDKNTIEYLYKYNNIKDDY